jgi:hypothetical protein
MIKSVQKPGQKKLEELIETLLWSGFIAKERPISAVLVAPPGSGKTTLLETYESTFSPFFSDMTSREISSVLKEKQDATHVLVGDLMSIVRHKKGTAALTINMLSQLSGDTMRQDAFTGQAVKRRIGIISAIPPDDMNSRQIKKIFSEGGFASRFLIAKYTYTPETVNAIHKYISSGAYKNEQGIRQLKVGPPLREIQVSKTAASEIRELALVIRRDPIGARAHHYLRTLAMCIAARDLSRDIKTRHLKKLNEMASFFTDRGVEL